MSCYIAGHFRPVTNIYTTVFEYAAVAYVLIDLYSPYNAEIYFYTSHEDQVKVFRFEIIKMSQSIFFHFI